MTLTDDQTAAISSIDAFLRDKTMKKLDNGREVYAATSFLLEGGAGVGKTFLLGQILGSRAPGMVLVATPTHKATNVIRRKLSQFGASWCRGYDPYLYNGTDVVTGTTAQLLGIGPVVTDDQTKDKVSFGRTGTGILGKMTPALLVIDEASMLGWPDCKSLIENAQRTGMKILFVGDSAQLPPVKQEAIPFDRFKRSALLRQIVRQAEGSAIISVAWAIRDGQEWHGIAGPGLRRVDDMEGAFLESVQTPGDRPEEDRETFIAYTNAKVNSMQEAACRRVYGHGRLEFAASEMVLSETNYYRGKQLMCSNQDELVVERFLTDEADEVCGVPVVLRHRHGDTYLEGSFRAFYLSPEEVADKSHPYNVELKKREALAQKLQDEFKRLPRNSTAAAMADPARRTAWAQFFKWRDQTIITFRHPFAVTSHKSQGSTYREVYADTADLGRRSRAALYVAVTRPRETLIVAR